MCRNGGKSMTGPEQEESRSARGRAAISSLCWRVSVAVAALAATAHAAPPTANQQSSADNSKVATAQVGGDATSSRAARDEAVRAVPWKLMSPANRQTAQT